MPRDSRSLVRRAAVEVLPRGAVLLATPIVDEAAIVSAWLAGRPETTQRSYRDALEAFARWLGLPSIEAVLGLLLRASQGQANLLVAKFKGTLIELGQAPSSVNNRLSAIKSLVRAARQFGMIPWTLEIRCCRPEVMKDTRGPTKLQVRDLLRAAHEQRGPKGPRDVLLVRLMFDLALRVSEACGIDFGDLNLERGEVSVVGKGHRAPVRLALPKPTMRAIELWLDIRGRESGPLLVTLCRGGWLREGLRRMNTRNAGAVITRLGVMIGVKLWPHALRHASITAALNATGGDLRRVQRFSRHRSIEVLMKYDDQRLDPAPEVAAMVARQTPTPTEPALDTSEIQRRIAARRNR